MQDKQERLVQKLELELGEDILAALYNYDVTEIMLNPDGALWIECHQSGMQTIGEMSAVNALALMGTIADALGTEINPQHPILQGELPLGGSRFEGLIPPVVANPTFTIRKPANLVFSLADYVEQGIMTPAQHDYLIDAIASHKNILVSGGTGSGKTTLTNALIRKISDIYPDERLIIIEDTAEIQATADNVVMLHTSSRVDMLDLLKATMRLRPDRILVGEVRGGEALALLKSWNTGHAGGVATIHANNAQAALIRLEQLVSEATTGGGMVMQPLIAEAVDVVIQIIKHGRKRQISEMISVNGLDDSGYRINLIGE